MRGLAGHDEQVLESMYRMYFPMVARLICQNHGDEDEAKDVFQEAMMVLYGKARDKGFVLDCQLKTYLYAVCRRLWLKQLEQRQRKPLMLIGDDSRLPDLAVDGDLQRHEEEDRQYRLMGAALQQLGEPCRSLLEDFYLRHRSMQELVEKFGYTNTDNAKTQKYKCLNRLKKIFFTQYKMTEEE